MTAILAIAAMTASLAAPVGVAAEARVCLSSVETRDSVVAHGLRDPMNLLREAARETRAEPLGTRLCRWGNQFVYEMSLLRRDGRVVRIYLDAASGQRVNAREARER